MVCNTALLAPGSLLPSPLANKVLQPYPSQTERVSERERERNRGSMCVRVCLAEQTPAVIAAPLLTITCSLLNTFATLVT